MSDWRPCRAPAGAACRIARLGQIIRTENGENTVLVERQVELDTPLRDLAAHISSEGCPVILSPEQHQSFHHPIGRLFPGLRRLDMGILVNAVTGELTCGSIFPGHCLDAYAYGPYRVTSMKQTDCGLTTDQSGSVDC